MKCTIKNLVSIMMLLCVFASKAQSTLADEVIKHLETLEDQFGNSFQRENYPEKVVLFVTDNDAITFRGIHMKFKGKTFNQNVAFVSSYERSLNGADPEKLKNHLQEGYPSALGENSFSIYLDMTSQLLQMLDLKQYSIVTLKDTDIHIVDFGSDRANFLNTIRNHLNEKS